MRTHTDSHRKKVSDQKKLVHQVYRLTEAMIQAHRQSNMQKRNDCWKQLLELLPNPNK